METDWHNIITFNGTEANAFEEMVCQIAMGENPGPDAKFERKGTPDGGVECYWKLTDGREFAWQAKYFNDLDASEWASI